MSGHCPNHGPYDGDACPFPPPHGNEGISGGPPSLDDDAPTDLGNHQGGGRYDNSGEEPTEIPGGGRRGRFLDEDEEETDLGRGRHDDLDVTELESPNLVTLAMLWVKEGRKRGRTYPVKHGTVVGRKEGNLILDDPKVSSMHAKFNMEGDNFVVWDFGSANGTYVNGKRIREATILEENDLVKIGETVFIVKLLEPRLKKRVTRAASKSKKPPTGKKTKK
jgi:hypothetical protein